MKRRKWLIVVAVVALLVALGYFAASRPSRIERDLEKIANKYGLEKGQSDELYFVGNGIPIEESRKLGAEIAQLAKDYGLHDNGGWSNADSAFRAFTALDADYHGVRLSLTWEPGLYTSVWWNDNRGGPLDKLPNWLKDLAP